MCPTRAITGIYDAGSPAPPRRDLQSELVRRVFKSSQTGILTTFGSALFFSGAAVLWVEDWRRIAVWASLVFIAVGLRIVLDREFAKTGVQSRPITDWINRLCFLIFLSSLATALIVPMLWSEEILAQFLLLLLLAVHAMLGTMNHAANLRVVAAHLSAVALTAPIFLITRDEPIIAVLGPAAFGFTIVCFIFAAISHRLMVEAIMQGLNAEAARDDAVAASMAKSRFLATMSHELRTPLNAIIGFAGVLQRDLEKDRPQQSAYATQIERAGSHLLRLINDILDMSKIEAGRMELRPEWIPIEEIIADCKAVLRQESHQAKITYDISAAPLRIWGDLRAVSHIIINLLSNAVKFTPKEGTIRCIIEGTGQSGVKITIADTGIGMTKDEIATALEPFGQVDSSYSRRFQGTGLGLPIVRAMTQLHEGNFSISSIPGSGTTVTIWLPIPEQVSQGQAGA